MKTGNEPAFATPEVDTPDYRHSGQIGLTKREYFAAMAMQGLLTDQNITGLLAGHQGTDNREVLATASVLCADSLLEALEKTATPNT